METNYGVTVRRTADGSGSGSETDNWVQYWAIESVSGKELDWRKWKFFAVRRAKQIARERGETFISIKDERGKTRTVGVG